MKKFIFNSPPTNTGQVSPYFKDKTAFEDFIVIDNYLVMRESTNTLSIFKISKEKISAEFFKKITLSNKNQIKAMDAINPRNLFIIFHNKEVCVVDIEESKERDIIINDVKNSKSLNGNTIAIHDQCLLNNSKKNIYIGIISVNSTDLYLAYKNDESKIYVLNSFFIKKFQKEIIHIEYKFIQNNSQVYCFICVLCKLEGYVILEEVDSNKKVEDLVKNLQNQDKWIKIFTEETSVKYYYSFYFHPSNHAFNSFLIFTENNKCLYWTFNSNLTSQNFLTKNELLYKCDKYNIISINHYSTNLYIITKKDIFEFKLLPQNNTPMNTISTKNIIGIIKSNVYLITNQYFLFCITSKDLFSYPISSASGHHHSGSSISLSGIENKDSTNFSMSNLVISKPKAPTPSSENTNVATPKESSPNNSNANNNNNVIHSPPIMCTKCEKPAKYRCTMCKKFFVCELNEHEIEWKEHEKSCPIFLRKNKIEIYTNLIPYQSEWDAQRKEIIELLKQKNYALAIEKNYTLIQDNFIKLTEYEKLNQILPFRNINTVKNNSDRILSSFLYYEDYLCNLLLLIYAFSLFKSKDEVWRLLNRLIKIMETFNFTGVTDIIVTINKDKIQEPNGAEKLGVEQEIYLRILKLLITIARYGHSLGEFTFYEKYLLDYVQKIQLVYSSDSYIMNNTYLLLGNLYVGFNLLKKAHMLFDFIIETNNLSNKENQPLYEVVLCANYNSGLINFVIDKYELAKQRLETALKIKRELLKEKNDLQISIIYEALAEIDIEYKNYSSAFLYLQKAIEARELSNTNDKEFKLKAQELREYIEQNSMDTKTNLNSNLQLRRGKNTEEVENEKLILNLLSDCPVNVDKNPDVTELEKFFLFMTKLSFDKIQKLNDDQPEDYEKNKFFPIVFSKNFKNSLTHNQRLALCDLKLTSLTRINVLKNYMKKITIKNLNYNALNLVPPENNINSIRNLYVTKSILKNWEIKDKAVLQQEKDEENEDEKDLVDIDEESNRHKNEHEHSIENDNNDVKQNPFVISNNKDTNVNIPNSSQKKKESNFSQDKNSSPEKEVDYYTLKNSIKAYCREKYPEKEKYVDDKFLFLLSRQEYLPKEELIKAIEHPEIINIILDTYIDVIKDSNVNEVKEQQVADPFDNFLETKKNENVESQLIPTPPEFIFQKIV